MQREKNGRFKRKKIEIELPSLSFLIKYSILIAVLLPWIYFLLFKFDILASIQNGLIILFGPIQESCECPSQSQKAPY